MRKVIVGLMAALLFLFTACGVSVDAGTVSDKRMEEAYTEQVEITEEECEWDTDTKYVNGKSKTTREYECETVGTGEFEDVDHPARFFVTLKDKDGNDEEHEVSESDYNSLEVDDFFDTQK